MSEMDGHTRFEELAAGYALGALEPADEVALRAHLAGCRACSEISSAFGDVAGGLATLAMSEAPPPELWSKIRAETHGAASVTDGPAVDTTPTPVTLPRRLPVRPLAIAAAALGVLGVGGWLVADRWPGHGTQSVTAAIASCRQSASCTSVELRPPGAGEPAAFALVRGRHVQMLATELPPIDAADHTYVLWEMSTGHRPAGLMAFAITARHHVVIGDVTLRDPYTDRTRFAITLETGTAIPATPSRTIAAGSGA